MSKQKAVTPSSFLSEVFHFGVYKSSQGRVTRQATVATLGITLLIGTWQLYQALYDAQATARWVVPLLVLVVGIWISFRIINYPRFADFLIAVEAEINKVSWPSRTELIRSSIVVIFLIFAMAMILFGYDLVWQALFKGIGVLK